jgi:hypothetical protein
MKSQTQIGKTEDSTSLSPAEKRAARAERVHVSAAVPYGWIARSETDTADGYHLFCDPETRHLACTCGDFVFRGNAEPGYECKHVTAVLKFIGREYLKHNYEFGPKRLAS